MERNLFPLPQQALLTQQVVTAVTLHLTRNPPAPHPTPPRSLGAKETVVQINAVGDYSPCEKAAKITAAGPQNEYPEKQRCRIHCCGVLL